MDTLLQDLRFGFRSWRKSPGFTAAALLTMTLGIGANTAIFSLVNAVLLHQLPYRDAEQLVWVWATRTDRDKAFYSIPNFIETSEQQRSLEQVAAFANWAVNLTGAGESERLQGVRLSPHTFQMLGVEAALGRLLNSADERPESGRAALLSYGLWQRRFGRDPNVIGLPLTLNGNVYTVVGVLPLNFTIPNAEIEIATSLSLQTDPRREERGSNFLRVFGRLKDGVTITEARADLARITAGLRQQYPDDNAKLTAPNVLHLQDEIVGGYRTALWLLLGAVGLVLLIACANLANLLLARAMSRHKEAAIRAALGATRLRLVRQMLTESVQLAVTGGALGTLVAISATDLLLELGPADFPRASEVVIDGRMLLFSLAVSVASGIAFGLAPALHATKTDLNTELKEGGRGGSSGTSSRLRNGLIITEVSLALAMLIGAGLLINSFTRLQGINPGFETNNLLALRLSLPASSYPRAEVVRAYYDKVAVRLSALDGVRAIGAATVLPLSVVTARTEFTIVGDPPATLADTPAAQDRWVSPGYFQMMKIPLIVGREFTAADDERSRGVIVIDETLARRYWRDDSPLGSHVRLDYGTGEKPREFEIVGIVGNVKHGSLNEEPTATLYGPLGQVPPSVVTSRAANLSIVVRGVSEDEPQSLTLRHEVQTVDPNVPASNVRPMRQFLAASLAARRFNLSLLVVFSVAALVLAAAGLYAVISYTVEQRSREIGIRMALGASRGSMLRLVMGQGLTLTLTGVVFGVAAALGITRLLSSLLFGITATDPMTFASAAVTLMLVAGVACYIPARRAMRVDPVVALRRE